MKKILIASVLALSAVSLGAVAPVNAQGFPTKNIVMIVPFPAGGPSDTVARIMAEGMTKYIGQNVLIENVGGAGGTVGATRAAEAAADGYTLLAGSMGTMIAAPTFYPNLKYDATKDFEPIGMTADMPAAVAVKAGLPVNNVKEFVDYVKKHGADVKQAHGGIGASSHMACLLFNKIFDLKPTQVAYRGTGPAMNDLLGGHIDYYCEQVVNIAPNAVANKVKALVVSTNERLAVMPDVPSAKEAGAPDYQLNVWNAIYAPKGTPKEALAKLNDALSKTLDDPETAKKLGNLGATVPKKDQRGPDFLRKSLAEDIPRWAPILKEASAQKK
ncbi:MAG: tripartite tricarboxylate transporter substrate-binding protein [Pseudolabrys sp.]|nr:tripartite tricarboxylate transporter substrate-binding protein [Pseudolabrys sp.]